MQRGKAGLRYNTTGEPFLHIRFPGTRLSVLSRPPFFISRLPCPAIAHDLPSRFPFGPGDSPALPAEYPAGRRIFRLEITMDARWPLSGAVLFVFSGSERLRTAMIIFYSAVTPYAYAGFLSRFNCYRRAQKKERQIRRSSCLYPQPKNERSSSPFFSTMPLTSRYISAASATLNISLGAWEYRRGMPRDMQGQWLPSLVMPMASVP